MYVSGGNCSYMDIFKRGVNKMQTCENKERKHSRGDRRDGYLVHETDAMHAIMPFVMPNRADNEAVLNTRIDLTAIEKYISEKNADNPEFKYTLFHAICASLAKTIAMRPKLNRFYSGYRLYDRKDIILAFVVKKKLVDDSDEVLAIVKVDANSDVPPIEQIYLQIKKIVYATRKQGKDDGATDAMGILNLLPRPILKMVMNILRWLEYHGKYPKSLMDVDPYYATVFISNLGSIKMNANYHHLANWGTNSFFMTIGEKKPAPFFNQDGSYEMKTTLDLGLTIDERIADGVYYANSVKVLKEILNNPEILDKHIMEPLEKAEI